MFNRLTLRQARIIQGYSIKQVAAGTKVSASTIRRYEEDSTKADTFYLYHLCHFYGVNPIFVHTGKTPNGELPDQQKPVLDWTSVIEFLETEGYDTSGFQRSEVV